MPNPATLRATCSERAYGLLKSGMWEDCTENPFSCMPVSVVQDILSCVCPAELALNGASIGHSRLLLTSGKIEHVVLYCDEIVGDDVNLLQMVTRGCQNLRRLSILDRRKERRNQRIIEVELALQKLLRKCAKLEYLHSCIYFDPKSLRECRNLKNFRLHFGNEEVGDFSRHITSDILQRLRSVEVFALCLRPWHLNEDVELHVTRAVIENCPQLTSLGFLDSSTALKELHDSDMITFGTPRQFQLLRCYWSFRSLRMPKSEVYHTIRVAALSCPMVEVLAIEVLDARCLRHLTDLRNLNCLVISFFLCEKYYVPEFYSLLNAVGPQLRHLSVYGYGEIRLSVDVICRNCPNLRTLKLDCPVTAEEDADPCVSLLNLERLSVMNSDRKTLFFLLWNCLHLKVLCLEKCTELDDGAMQAILKKNPFAGLEVALIRECSLSESGWREFLQSEQKLTECCFHSHSLGNFEMMRCMRDVNPSAVCHFASKFNELEREQFPLKMRALEKCSCWF